MTHAAVEIRPAVAADAGFLREAIIELQEHERALHDTRRPGKTIANSYLDWIQAQSAETGALLIAQLDGVPVGFAAGWIEDDEALAETPDSNRFGLVSDVCVLPAFRGRRIAAQLMARLEERLLAGGVTRIRVTALAANASARRSYESAGYTPYEVTYEKRLTPPPR